MRPVCPPLRHGVIEGPSLPSLVSVTPVGPTEGRPAARPVPSAEATPTQLLQHLVTGQARMIELLEELLQGSSYMEWSNQTERQLIITETSRRILDPTEGPDRYLLLQNVGAASPAQDMGFSTNQQIGAPAGATLAFPNAFSLPGGGGFAEFWIGARRPLYARTRPGETAQLNILERTFVRRPT